MKSLHGRIAKESLGESCLKKHWIVLVGQAACPALDKKPPSGKWRQHHLKGTESALMTEANPREGCTVPSTVSLLS